jgi:chloramphenicol-sensitive protein RarD
MPDQSAATAAAARESRIGLIAGVGAFTLWGLYPFYFKALASIPALEIVAHRIVWSVALLACALPFAGRWRALVNALRTPATLGWLAVTTVLISANWLVYVLAVTGGQVLDASLGYFLCPLVNVALGVVVLKSGSPPPRPRPVALAAGAVLVPVWQLGAVPKVALFLAVSFGVYGMLRKRLAVDAATGLLVECVLALPLSAGIALWLGASGELRSPGADGWTVGAPPALRLRDRRPAPPVHDGRAPHAARDARTAPVHRAQHAVPRGRARLRRAGRALAPRGLRPDLGRPRPLHRRRRAPRPARRCSAG